MLCRSYSGARLDSADVLGAINVLRERVDRRERAEFHAGAAAALSIIISHDLRDQSEFIDVLDSLYNDNNDYYTVRKDDNHA